MSDVAIVGGTEDIRLLLRGLARLHRHHVVVEGPSPATLDAVGRVPGPLVLLIEVDLTDPVWSEPVGRLLTARPDVHAILITPRFAPRLEEEAKALGLRSVLRRPFAVHQLVELLAAAPVAPEAAAPGDGAVRATQAKE